MSYKQNADIRVKRKIVEMCIRDSVYSFTCYKYSCNVLILITYIIDVCFYLFLILLDFVYVFIRVVPTLLYSGFAYLRILVS